MAKFPKRRGKDARSLLSMPTRDKEPSEECKNHVRHGPKIPIPLVTHHPTDSSINEVVHYREEDDELKLVN